MKSLTVSELGLSESSLVDRFRRELEKQLRCELDLVVNENRSTMLSVLERRRGFARLSVHKMFLDAPEEVVSAVAGFVKGGRPKRGESGNLIRGYIQTNLARFDYSHLLKRSRFETKGRFYDLKELYDGINEEYFEGKLDLAITWYGTHGRKNMRKVVFGEYFDHLRLIKIHRILDDPFFPDFFVRYVLYHEMVHHIVPGYVDGAGFFRSHGADFKEKEVLFKDYARAIRWEKLHKEQFFRKRY